MSVFDEQSCILFTAYDTFIVNIRFTYTNEVSPHVAFS